MTNEGSGDVADGTFREFARGQKLFGRYTLVKILGRGGMGIVWLARDEELERDVALKFLPDVIVHDRSLLNELKRETRRSLELTHKNIVRIHDFVNDERSACISMEYIDGDTLSNLRAAKEQKVFEPNELNDWTSQLCDALDYAHNHARIIHRDLKPTNLMVNQKGDLKVSDFGIARSLGDSMSKLTTPSGTSGTLVYMSPQQLDGERGTHLDDIYSLGATLYDLLTSKPPFYSGNVDRQIHERVAPSMTERRKEFNIEPAFVPPLWEETIAACLAKDPAHRPQSTAEIAQRLQLSAPQTRGITTMGKPSPGHVALCSICGRALNAKGECMSCLVRLGFDQPLPELSSAVFGDFEIARREDGSFWELGRGAMGVTYRAEDKVLNRSVALKVIDAPAAEGGGQAVRDRFLREARAAAAFRHPNVAGVFHFGASTAGDRCYYAMELVEGETLEALVRRDGPLKVKAALEMAVQVTRALIAAAAHGLIHRDLKPGNIMLMRSDAAELEVKVIDFGLAKAIADGGKEMDLTKGGFIGTPAFASPEQFSGAPADARSDIYSLGVTLWYALTGEVPYEGKTIEEIRHCQSDLPLPVQKLVARKIPTPVIQLLRRILAVDPTQRPASARDFMEALDVVPLTFGVHSSSEIESVWSHLPGNFHEANKMIGSKPQSRHSGIAIHFIVPMSAIEWKRGGKLKVGAEQSIFVVKIVY